MRHASLFSGIGAPDLAAEWMGWHNSFHCEINPFGQKLLKYYWPNSISYDNIKTTDFSIHRGTIDVLTGGFPCQPYSTAGLRKGKEDERHLWPEMLRAIRQVQPRWVVGENVLGLVSWNGGLVFEEVQADLEAEGYEVQPFIFPACAVDAPHRRERVWFVAYASHSRLQSRRKYHVSLTDKIQEHGIIANPTGFRCNRNDRQRKDFKQSRSGRQALDKHNGNGWQKSITDTGRIIDRWANFPTQSPICDGNDGISSRLDGITFSDWRTESIKAGGNAIVPQAIHQIFKAIESYEHLKF